MKNNVNVGTRGHIDWGKKMKPSEKCKAAGLINLKELSEITKQSTQTLRNWDINKPELFEVVLKGAKVKKNEMQS